MELREVTIITHVEGADVAWIVEEIENRGLGHRIVRPYRGEALPQADGVICLGGYASAYEVDEHPHLQAEIDYLGSAVRTDVPVLGICLGSQLLAVALGGEAMPGEHGPECGLIEVKPLDGAEHPLADRLPGTQFSFHSDTCLPPPGATHLAASDRYLQAWSLGSALAIQFHPELSAAGVARVAELEGPKLAAAGLEPDDLVRTMNAYEPRARARCADLVGGWLDLAIARSFPTAATDVRREQS